MTFLSRMFEQRSIENPGVLFSASNVDSGVNVTERSSLQVSTVWRCVNILANAAASTPLTRTRTARSTSSRTRC
jgi:phage portal protein BeeE